MPSQIKIIFILSLKVGQCLCARSRDFSEGNISWLRVERKEIAFSDTSLEMDSIDSSETKGSAGEPQVQLSVSVGHQVSNPLFRHLAKHFNPHERNGDRG
jgi:hypothetical protein